jgi:hypothetical protein
VDKTRHIFQLVDEGKFYFMARPRRFGKSLMVSTLKCLFEAKKELFKGLWIFEHGNWEWTIYPVIVIDFNEIPHSQPDIFKQALSLSLKHIAHQYDISFKTDYVETQFQELILALYQQSGNQVCILIDEYDKPIIDHLGKSSQELNVAKQNRELMKSFFSVLKGVNTISCLRFVFLTGISRFSRVSIFSELNNLEDISMSDTYADMFGYTQKELESNFYNYINILAEQSNRSDHEIKLKLKKQYNGYRFCKKDICVYNPFSILSVFKQKDFKNFWFDTGTPTFLINILRKKDWYIPEIEGMKTSESVFATYDLENLEPEALLFQTGYATIRDVEGRIYTFDYPNQEVKIAFLESLFHSYTEGMKNRSNFVFLTSYLQSGDIQSFMEMMSSIFASIPYTLNSKRDEAYFHTIFYLMICASGGGNAQSEILTCNGRIDLIIEFLDKVYILEFKCNQSAETALKQIKTKKYADKYIHKGKEIICMGINFDSETRNVLDWKLA